jgi:hypothetical protein
MMIARWHIDARFGSKPEVIESMQGWARDIAPQIGWTADKVRVATGSIGALESTIEVDVTISRSSTSPGRSSARSTRTRSGASRSSPSWSRARRAGRSIA